MRASKLVTPLLVALALLAAGGAHAATNPQVAGLQVALRAHGLYNGPIDGIAGPRTAFAVRSVQQRSGLAVDGIPGRQTRSALGRLGRPLFGKRTMARRDVGWDVSVLQFLLTRRGFPTRIVDGYFGAETQAAVRRFQRAAGLAADGVAGPLTIASLTRTRAIPERPRDDSPGDVRSLVNHWSAHYGVEPSLARALAWQESGFQTNLTSGADAWGVMQVTPATWDFVETVLLARNVPRTVDGNVRVGVAYLRHLLRRFGGDTRLAIAAYHQGERAVRQSGLFRETKLFVANVLALRGRV